MLNKATLDWLEKRKDPDYFCKTHCKHYFKLCNGGMCLCPPDECFFINAGYESDLYLIRLAEKFDRAVEKRVKEQTGNREELIKTARIELEAEWDYIIDHWETLPWETVSRRLGL